MAAFEVVFLPEGKKIVVSEGASLMEAMNNSGFEFDFPCGGRRSCGKCRVKISAGVGSPTVSEMELLRVDELAEGTRLACQTVVHGPMTVEMPGYVRLEHSILTASGERPFQIAPHFDKVTVEVPAPGLDNPKSDWSRLLDGLEAQDRSGAALSAFGRGPSLDFLRRLPDAVRGSKGPLTAVMYNNQVFGLEAGDTTETMLGMAFDIGTTTLVGYLMNLKTGQELGVVSTLNPQTQYGADVISRVNFAVREEKGLIKLHRAVAEAINKMIGEAAKKASVSRNDIYAVTVAANTCMHHLFFGITPRNIALSPYVPAVTDPVTVRPQELKIEINPAGRILALPNIAGFVGADTTAVLLAAELDKSEDIKLILDIGTNGEIALGSRERIYACSAAAGPAFEGAQISSGMRGAVGAIDHVFFKDRLEYSVIGGVRPLGICGSALLDTVAGLIELGIVDKRGRLLSPEKLTNPGALNFADRLAETEEGRAFILADAGETGHGRPITVTQKDIRELQLAKGAMAAGVRVLMEILGINAGEISEVLLAGAFGNYLTPHSACQIGLLPAELEDRIHLIGNAAGTGAKLALLSQNEYLRSAVIAQKVSFVELGSYPKFNSIFAECTYLGQ